jgi:capsular exopolysaccharide synthesis family protein
MSSVAECCRTIRTNLTFMAAEEPLRALVVTSAGPREGKTTVASNLAIALAQSGKRVLLVDTDLRRPRIHRTFAVSSAVGITSVLVGEARLEEAVNETAVPGLWVLPCGPIPPNPSELLHTTKFRDLVQEASKQFDRVIFDSPPLGAVTDAAIIAPQVDGVIVVMKVQHTNRDTANLALRQLRDVGAVILGSILNDVNLAEQRYGYGSYYYYRRQGYYSSDPTAPPDDDVRSAAPGD